MKLNETTLPFLEVDCIQQFGQEKGKLIFEQAEKIYQELLNNADYRNNAAIQNHLQLKLWLPIILQGDCQWNTDISTRENACNKAARTGLFGTDVSQSTILSELQYF